jgi:large subunit ribosomal protein L25
MTDKHIFKAQKRELVGKKVSQLRKQGIGVGSVSTPNGESISIQFQDKAVEKLLASTGESTLVYLSVEGESKQRPVLLEEVQYDPLTHEMFHVAFRQVSLKQKVSAAIPVEVVGEVDVADATLVVVMHEVEVEALPTDLPEKFEVDVTNLTEVGQTISLADLQFDREKVTLVLGDDQDAATMPVVMIQAVKEEVEEAPVEAAEGEAAAETPAEAPAAEPAAEEPAA